MKIAIIGTGPSGIMAGIIAQQNGHQIIFFDDKSPLSTILPTGGGRCNLAYAEFDNRELINFYPRGKKFLLSTFSQFSTADTLEFFEKIGIQTYIQDDLRIFPTANSSKFVQEKMLKQLNLKNVRFIKEKILNIEKIENKFKLSTKTNTYEYEKIIFAGGIKNNYDLLKNLNINLIPPKPALCAICCEEKELYSLAGLSFKNIYAKLPNKKELFGDILITHKSLSGPLAYKISSICAYEKFPYKISFNFVNLSFEELDKELIKQLNQNSKKDFINIISEFIPRSFAKYLLQKSNINENIKANQVNKNMRNKLTQLLTNYELNIISQKQDGEIVTAGGVNLDFINPKTMEYKKINGLYFCGEVLDIDGFTGGFNLQNCWSTGYIAGKSI